MKQEVFFFFFSFMTMSPGQGPNRMDSAGSAPSSARPGAKDTNSTHSHFVPTLSSAPCCEGPHQTRVGSPSLQVSAWPNPSPSCAANSHSSATSPAWEYAPYRLVKAVDLGGQGHDPGNEECNGGEEGSMGLVAPIVLHLEAWLEDAWSRAFQQEGLRAGALAVWREAGGGKHTHTHTHCLFHFIFIF